MNAIGTKPKGEVIFKGPPMRFAQIMESISGRLTKEGGPLVGIRFDQRYPDPNVLKIELTSPNPDTGQIGRLEVIKTGEGKSDVVVAANRDESLFAEWWEPSIMEMDRLGLLDTLQPTRAWKLRRVRRRMQATIFICRFSTRDTIAKC